MKKLSPLFMLLSFLAQAETPDPDDLFEKTWPRASSACHYNKKRIELFIRGGAKFTESKERGYGEYVFVRYDEKLSLLTFPRSQGGLHRFFAAKGDTQCSKTLGYPLSGDRFAILIGEENRPSLDKLVIQIYDFTKMQFLQAIETDYIVDKAYARPGGFVFKCLEERYEMDMGHVKLGKDKLIYQDRVFPKWRRYSDSGIELDPSTTYSKLPWRSYFKDESDFLKASAWDSSKKEFLNKVVYFASKQGMKKRCVLFVEKKQKLTGTEDWRCHL